MTYPREDALGKLVQRIRATGHTAAAASDRLIDPTEWRLWVDDHVIAWGATRDGVAEAGERWLEEQGLELP